MSPNEASWQRWQDEIREEGRIEFQKQIHKALVSELKPTEEINDEWDQGFDEAIQLAIAIVERGID